MTLTKKFDNEEIFSNENSFFEMMLGFFSPFQYLIPYGNEEFEPEKGVREKYKQRINKMQSYYLPKKSNH